MLPTVVVEGTRCYRTAIGYTASLSKIIILLNITVNRYCIVKRVNNNKHVKKHSNTNAAIFGTSGCERENKKFTHCNLNVL